MANRKFGVGYQVEKYQREKAEKAERERLAALTVPPVSEQEPVVAVSESTQTETTQEPSLAAAFTMMAELLREMKGSGNADEKARMLAETERLLLEQKRMSMELDREARSMPENKIWPGVSVYSYPEGEVARPKPKLINKVFWVGYDLTPDTLTPSEIEAVNSLKPGDYQVTKADGQKIAFKVNAKYTDIINPETNTFTIESLSVSFPCKGEARHNHLSLKSYCTQAMGKALPNAEDLLEEIAKLRAELAAA